METYKNMLFYEEILKANGCDINHFTGTNKEIYNFSKIIIRKVILIEDWGISPFKEKAVTSPNGRSVSYNYWDYIQAFDKCFLYENERRSHTWFFKICSEIYNFTLPGWFINWWKFYGTTDKILPDIIKNYYEEWIEVKPHNQDEDDNNVSDSMRFFIEFSVPWIWKSNPITGYNQGIFCLKRKSYSRFWEKMVQEDKEKQLNCLPTINLLKGKIGDYKLLKDQEQERLKDQEKTKFLEILDDETSMDIHDASEEDIVKAYMSGLQKTLELKKEGDKRSTKSDDTMVSNTSQNSYNLLQDSQEEEDPEEITKKAVLAFLQIKKGK